MPWQITWEEHVVREVDLTIDDCEELEAETGETWLQMSPVKSAKVCKAIFVHHLVKAKGMSPAEAKAYVGKIKPYDLLDGVALRLDAPEDTPDGYDEHGNPLLADDRSTG